MPTVTVTFFHTPYFQITHLLTLSKLSLTWFGPNKSKLSGSIFNRCQLSQWLLSRQHFLGTFVRIINIWPNLDQTCWSQIFGPTFCWIQNFVIWTHNYLGPKILFGINILNPKIILDPNFLITKFLCTQISLDLIGWFFMI